MSEQNVPKDPVSPTDAELDGTLEETWQMESPETARRTEFADEVDGELGTRDAD